MKITKELIINALLAGFWAALAAFSTTQDFSTSALFLLCYLIYHATHLATVFPGHGAWRWVYYAILIPHIILAVAVPPMALILLYRAWKGDFARHKRLARWALPIWLYVSVTGVVVYWMLYRVQWA